MEAPEPVVRQSARLKTRPKVSFKASPKPGSWGGKRAGTGRPVGSKDKKGTRKKKGCNARTTTYLNLQKHVSAAAAEQYQERRGMLEAAEAACEQEVEAACRGSMVVTRKRAAEAGEQPVIESIPKRIKHSGGPQARASPHSSPQQAGALAGASGPASAKKAARSVPTKGSRGKAFLAAAGITLPSAEPVAAASPPRLSSKKASAVKAARVAADQEAADQSVLPSARKTRNPLLQQALPSKLSAILDMFGGLQTVYEMMRKREQRTTFQNMRAAVEDASRRRFLMSHVAQLKQLLPEVLSLEWVRLPVAAHSSRTEPHLLITLDMSAATSAAVEAGAVVPSGGEGQLQAVRHLLHCRLAGHLLDSYRGHLAARAAEVRAAGDEEAARQLEEAAQAAANPPVKHFRAPFPEGTDDVAQADLPPHPNAPTPSRGGGSPAVLAPVHGGPAGSAGPQGGGLGSAAPELAAAAALPATPNTSIAKATGTTGRTGRPPRHPSTVGPNRLMQKRLSFGGTAAGGAGPSQAPGRVTKPAGTTPLNQLLRDLDRQHEAKQQQKQVQQEVHPRQRSLAASLSAAELQFGGSIPESPEEAAAAQAGVAAVVAAGAGHGRAEEQEKEQLLAGMPEGLRRYSTDGIISMDTLLKLEAAEQQHRRLSSQEAQAAREASAALGQLPRTFTHLQRIFGFQGPNALKLRDLVRRIKQGGAETSPEAAIEAALRALAQHAPEYVTLKPYGSCGTPALWVNRRANANQLMQRLRGLAEARRSSLGAAA